MRGFGSKWWSLFPRRDIPDATGSSFYTKKYKVIMPQLQGCSIHTLVMPCCWASCYHKQCSDGRNHAEETGCWYISQVARLAMCLKRLVNTNFLDTGTLDACLELSQWTWACLGCEVPRLLACESSMRCLKPHWALAATWHCWTIISWRHTNYKGPEHYTSSVSSTPD